MEEGRTRPSFGKGLVVLGVLTCLAVCVAVGQLLFVRMDLFYNSLRHDQPLNQDHEDSLVFRAYALAVPLLLLNLAWLAHALWCRWAAGPPHAASSADAVGERFGRGRAAEQDGPTGITCPRGG